MIVIDQFEEALAPERESDPGPPASWATFAMGGS